MNVFILNTGRCGSTTFIHACRHIANYRCAHESRTGRLGADRFRYPDRHIEADNRLSWVLGRLDQAYGKEAFYVHLTRSRAATAKSFLQRYNTGIMRAYRKGVLMDLPPESDPAAVAADYCETVDANIVFFLKDKPLKMEFRMETAKEDFRRFWEAIGAQGDLPAALAAWDTAYNPSEPADLAYRARGWARRTLRTLREGGWAALPGVQAGPGSW